MALLIKLTSDRVIKIPDDFNPHVSAFIELISVAYQGIDKFKQIAITKNTSIKKHNVLCFLQRGIKCHH